MQNVPPKPTAGPGFVIGLMLVAAGIASLLERAHVFESVSVGQWWPIVPIGLGVAKLRDADRCGAFMFLAVGAWGVVVVLTRLSFAETWPLLLMIWGASMMCRALNANGTQPMSEEESHVG